MMELIHPMAAWFRGIEFWFPFLDRCSDAELQAITKGAGRLVHECNSRLLERQEPEEHTP